MNVFTPGPWKVVDRSAHNTSASEPKWEIDQVSHEEPYWVALAINEGNAHLIAAAPEMYALLVESQISSNPSVGVDWRERRDAVLAKAEGKQQ